MTVANLKYNHIAQPWDAPLSFGIQAFIEYNGLLINDRNQSDVIRVNSITGLDGADIRDSREPKPSAHGEFVYDAFYAGRTLTLTGNLETGSNQVLRKMERDIKAAFAPLIESSLKFKWFDIEDNFDDPQSIFGYNAYEPTISGNYTSLIGSQANLKIENSQLSWSKASNIYIVRSSEQRTFCDAQSTLKVIPGSINNNSTIGFIHAVKDESNYLRFLYSQLSGEPFLSIESIISGEVHALSSIGLTEGLEKLTVVPGQPFWLRAKKEGNLLTVEYWLSKPEENSLPSLFTTVSLNGVDSELFGDTVMAQIGFGGEQKDTLWRFDEFKIESLYPGDVSFDARSLNVPSIKDEQTSLTKFKRPFQITMRSADFRAFSSTQSRKSIIPSEVSVPLLGRSYPRKYPLSYRHYLSSSVPLQSNIISINNRGSVFVEPILVVYGSIKNIYMENLTNGGQIIWNSTVKDKEILIFDCHNKTVLNELGSDMEEPLVPTLQWIKLDPMWNDLYINGTGFSSNTKLVVYWKHGY